MLIEYIVKRGRHAGATLTPHRHRDGCYVVSKSRFQRDYVRAHTLEEVSAYVAQGYSVRMSAAAYGAPTSLIAPQSLIIR